MRPIISSETTSRWIFFELRTDFDDFLNSIKKSSEMTAVSVVEGDLFFKKFWIEHNVRKLCQNLEKV